MNDSLVEFIKTERKHAGLTQEEFTIRSVLGRFFNFSKAKKTVELTK